jgi:hypothetical protein
MHMKAMVLVSVFTLGSLVEAAIAHLHPVTDRFVQRDPVEYVGGTSLYAYVATTPTNLRDPTGLLPPLCGCDNEGSVLPKPNHACTGEMAFHNGWYSDAVYRGRCAFTCPEKTRLRACEIKIRWHCTFVWLNIIPPIFVPDWVEETRSNDWEFCNDIGRAQGTGHPRPSDPS